MNPPTAPSITSNSRTGLASSRSPRRHLNRRNVTNATYPSAVVPHPPGASQNIRSAGQGNGVKKTVSIINPFLNPSSPMNVSRCHEFIVPGDAELPSGTTMFDVISSHLVPIRQEVGILFVDAAAGED